MGGSRDEGEEGKGARYMGGPRPLGALVPRLVRPAFRKRSPAGALLMADWAAVVGPALAAVTVPRRLSGGTLTVACAGPVAMELSHLAPQLMARINAHLGRVTVERLRFVQHAPPPGGAGVGGPAAHPPVQPEPSLPDRVETAIARVPGNELREALAKLGRGVYRNRG
jgi:hypothetical protein